MLKIQKLMLNNSNWEEILKAEPYNLIIKYSEDKHYVLFKYNQLSSDFNETICREARGLIIDLTKPNYPIVRMAFEKFFNLGEKFAAEVDWDTAVSGEKLDGSLISVWYNDGKWHISTNSTIDAYDAELSNNVIYKSFGELFESVLPLSWFENKDTNLCFTFELVSPYNKIVLDYPETKVYLLSIRNMPTLREYDVDELGYYAKKHRLTLPQYYYLNREKDFRNLVSKMDDSHEGIVVRDANNNRVKIKTLSYFELHKKKRNGNITLEYIVDLILRKEDEEFLSYFSEYKEIFEKVRKQIKVASFAIKGIAFEVNNWKKVNPNATRKDFSTFTEKHPNNIRGLYFAAFDNKLDKMVEEMPAKKYISIFKIEIKERG